MTTGLIVLAVLAAAFLWFVFGGSDRQRQAPPESDDVDQATLDEAETEVREAPNAEEVRDWGPGAGRPRPPHQL